MSRFTTSCSDHSKKAVTSAWIKGGLGTLGFHFFKVGRIKHGVIRILHGFFMWGIVFTALPDKDIDALGKTLFVLLLFAPSLVDRFRLYMGTFKDNIGNYVREP